MPSDRALLYQQSKAKERGRQERGRHSLTQCLLPNVYFAGSVKTRAEDKCREE